jgi:hypothetical protein
LTVASRPLDTRRVEIILNRFRRIVNRR